MNISIRLLAEESSPILQFTLENDCGMKVRILTLGASIQSILLPFPDGSVRNVVLSYADWESYRLNPLYLGSTLAPNAGRISKASLKIDETTFQLSQNEGTHNAHGGFHNASLQNWKQEDSSCTDDHCSVTLSVLLPDGLDGFPGNRQIQARYQLDNTNTLTLHYKALTDKKTYLNLSNHSYFNLSGDFRESGLLQDLKAEASTYVHNNQEHIPECIQDCSNTPFDFRESVSLLSKMNAYPADSQLINARGYNNALVFDAFADSKIPVLCLSNSEQTCVMELFTDAPSVVIYSGGYIGDGFQLAEGYSSSDSCAIALEAQDLPDTPNLIPEKCLFTSPGETYERTIQYRFR